MPLRPLILLTTLLHAYIGLAAAACAGATFTGAWPVLLAALVLSAATMPLPFVGARSSRPPGRWPTAGNGSAC